MDSHRYNNWYGADADLERIFVTMGRSTSGLIAPKFVSAARSFVGVDPGRGRRFVRFSFARSKSDVAELIIRLRDWDKHNTGVLNK